MKNKILLTSIMTSVLLFSGCTNNNNEASNNNSPSNIQSYNGPSNTDGVKSHPLILTSESTIPCPFISTNDFIYFPNWNDENRISSISKSSIKTNIITSDINDFFNYSTNYLTIVDNTIYFSDISCSNYLSSINLNDKSYKNLNSSKVSDICSIGTNLYYINQDDNNKLYSYNTVTNTEVVLSRGHVGKYLINGEFIFFQNMDDNMNLYKMRLDGSETGILTNFSVDSFIVIDGNILVINSADNNNLYKVDPITLNSTRLFLMDGSNLKYYNNKIYFINNQDSNFLYSLNINLENSTVTSTLVVKDAINDYYLNDYGIFLEKAIDSNSTYVISY